MKHAVIVTGGKQYRVAEGDVIFVEKLEAGAGEKVTFDNVLAVIDDIRMRSGHFAEPDLQKQKDPRIQDEAEKRLPQDTGSQTALHEDPDRNDCVIRKERLKGGFNNGS